MQVLPLLQSHAPSARNCEPACGPVESAQAAAVRANAARTRTRRECVRRDIRASMSESGRRCCKR